MKRPYAPKCYTDYLSVHPDDDHPIEAMNWADHLNVVAHIEAERDTLQALLEESQRCLKEAKRLWAPTTTNSDADVAIARNDAHLNPPKETDNE